MKTVCGVLTANCDFKIYTVSMLIYNWGWQFTQKQKIVMKCQTTVSLCTFSLLMCLPTSPYNSHKHLHICT